jgi:hypothetical protein
VLFIDIFKDPLREFIDDEFGYKLIVEYSPDLKINAINFPVSQSSARAIAHYFHFGPGDVHCWWTQQPEGKVDVSFASSRRVDGEVDLTFMPEHVSEFCRTVTFRGKFSLPRRWFRYLFWP